MWKLAFGHGEYLDLMLVMFQQSTSFLVQQVGVEKKQVLQHMDSAASLASSASEQAQVESLKRDWYDDVESIRWKRTYDALRCHNRMPHSYFLSKRSFSNLQKWHHSSMCAFRTKNEQFYTTRFENLPGTFQQKKQQQKHTLLNPPRISAMTFDQILHCVFCVSGPRFKSPSDAISRPWFPVGQMDSSSWYGE